MFSTKRDPMLFGLFGVWIQCTTPVNVSAWLNYIFLKCCFLHCYLLPQRLPLRVAPSALLVLNFYLIIVHFWVLPNMCVHIINILMTLPLYPFPPFHFDSVTFRLPRKNAFFKPQITSPTTLNKGTCPINPCFAHDLSRFLACYDLSRFCGHNKFFNFLGFSQYNFHDSVRMILKGHIRVSYYLHL